jgi:hypothetical protein
MVPRSALTVHRNNTGKEIPRIDCCVDEYEVGRDISHVALEREAGR